MLNKQIMVDADNALAGRQEAMAVEPIHFVNGSDITASATQGQQEILFGMGCFWGAERLFWQLDGVVSTSVGYSGGFTLNPTYQEVCSGQTGHTEVVRVIFDPQVLPLEQLLEKFWERHDPTQGMRQGNDLGTQYRSAIYTFSDQQLDIALASQQAYQAALANQQHNTIT
ncbi:peptide-methionine (S)-S-oxide reductase MsrA, partial [Vibrio vulnificus]